MRIYIILNTSAGFTRVNDPETINFKHMFKMHDIVAIKKTDGKKLEKITRQAIDTHPDLIVVAGGDGTVSAVASFLVGKNIILGILPTGTFNNFARDVGIPFEMQKAIDLIKNQSPTRIDVGQVNDVYFINNSSVGLYPKAIKTRDHYSVQLGGRKIIAMILAFFTIFTQFPVLHYEIEIKDKKYHHTSPFIFIGNNEYKLNLFKLGRRTTFIGGHLCLYTAVCHTRMSILLLIFKALFSRLNQQKNFKTFFVKEVKLSTRKNRVKIAKDGEMIYMKPPIRYTIQPKALSVIIPPQEQTV